MELKTVAWTGGRCLACGKPIVPEPGLGLTVGNRSDGFIALTLVPGIGGSPSSGGTLLDENGGSVALLAATTTSVADAVKGSAPLAVAFALKITCPARGAVVDSGAEASSS